MTDFISKQVFFARIKVIPRVEYTFQVIAREDKGSMLGIDYNKSKLSTFKTSRLNSNNQPFSNLPRPLNSNDPKLDYGNIQGPPPVPEIVSFEHFYLVNVRFCLKVLMCLS